MFPAIDNYGCILTEHDTEINEMRIHITNLEDYQKSYFIIWGISFISPFPVDPSLCVELEISTDLKQTMILPKARKITNNQFIIRVPILSLKRLVKINWLMSWKLLFQ